ncbi:aspartate aminotransferase family protein [Saccharothrix algeriensis]|uniref:Aminotransferase class III-fold pyridoxal phosphate-dependent enzyme n=1 Tax=Saccharothrix algeriensis TaxID=173560 RepID=A0A8T8HYK0_9PSEU|nr:aminotransferase class III-fold pyridoxal phosphate-dependent enzyme [Saccharothrix algeriensis]MBM7809272.1 glutamate-1-semialdehyde 2,1-aminomutase [Saccharothrix algeriensis]QTR03622.1 aminotransferase class III-fold pyridoxal phosphate-dependent enzyme [Saccharothrix algeriensis]
MSANDPVARGIRERYLAASPASAAAFSAAASVLPGGDTRTMTTYRPHPLYFEQGSGTRLKDVDGVWREDFLANYGALAHGHDHPAIVAAVREQVALGTAPGGPGTLQHRHARLLRELVPSLERLRYANSGTEATMWAIRTARAHTGREVLVKIDGGYHGTHDWGHVNAFITTGDTRPQPVAGLPPAHLARGVPAGVLDSVVAIPYNDTATAARVLAELRGRVAAVLVEPVLGVGGGVPADPAYLAALRRLTAADGVVLIFDECATVRLGPWQVRHGVEPDLSTFSKVVGGGLPIGVFGGRADIMAIFDPAGDDPVYHAGAFVGNNLSLAAGVAALEHLGAEDFAHLDALGERLRAGLARAAASVGVTGRAAGEGGLTYFHFTATPPRDAADTARARRGRGELRALVHLQLLNEGFVTARHGLLCQHVTTDPAAVDAFVEAYGNTLDLLLPYLSRHHPDLLEHAGARS